MSGLQWFAFVYLPLSVAVFGALFAAVTVGLILWYEEERE